MWNMFGAIHIYTYKTRFGEGLKVKEENFIVKHPCEWK